MYWKDENKEKEAGKGPFFKKQTSCIFLKREYFTNSAASWWANLEGHDVRIPAREFLLVLVIT